MSAAPPPGKPPTYYSAGRIAVLIIGTVLLLPGGCVFVMFVFSVRDAARKGQPLDFSDPIAQMVLIVWVVCLVISAVGVALIVAVMKRIRSAPRNTSARMTAMSEPDSAPPPGPASPHFTGGQLAMIAIGVLLLLPGLCSLFVMISMVPWNMNDPFFSLAATIWVICFMISAGGIAMIYAGRRRAAKAN